MDLLLLWVLYCTIAKGNEISVVKETAAVNFEITKAGQVGPVLVQFQLPF